MAKTTYVKPGVSIPYTPSSDVAAGDVLLVNDKLVVSKQDIPANTLGTVEGEGVFDFPKTAATVYDQFKKVYWDAADDEATEDADGGVNHEIGYVNEAALSADTHVRCYLENKATA